MSSRLRLTACFRAWRRSWLVLSSSTDTRRPRSAMRSMAFLLAYEMSRGRCAHWFEHDLIRKPVSTFRDHALASRPTLPHAELEDREIGGFQEGACHRHDFGRARAVAVGE